MFRPYTGEKCRKATALSFFISSNACRQLSHQTLERFLVMNVRCLQGMANCLTHKGVHGSKSTRHWNNLILWIASVVPWPFWYLKRYSWCFDWSGTIGWVCFRPEESLVLFYIHLWKYTLVETLRQVLFISKQNQHLFQHHVNGCLCISFPSFPTCPKKTSMKTTKIISHVFFAWEVSLFRLVCFHPNFRTKASAAATIRPPGQLEKFVPISSCPVGKESLYTARAPLNPQSQFHLLSTRDPQMCSWITRARSPVPRDSKKLPWSRQHRWMSSIIEEINGGWVNFVLNHPFWGDQLIVSTYFDRWKQREPHLGPISAPSSSKASSPLLCLR